MNKKQLRAKKKEFDKQRSLRKNSQITPQSKPKRASNPSQRAKPLNGTVSKQKGIQHTSSSNFNKKANSTKKPNNNFTSKQKNFKSAINNKLTPSQNEARLRQQEIIKNRPKRNIKRKKNYTIYYILLSIILIVSGTVLARNYLFQVSDITVITTDSYDKDKIISDSGILIGDNILKLNTSRIEKSILEKNTSLDSVEIKAKFPDKFEIEIVVATPDVILADKAKTTYYTLSTKQRIIGIDTKNSTASDIIYAQGITLPEVSLGSFVDLSKNSTFSKLKTIQKSLDRLEYTNVSLVDLSDIYNIKISLSRGIDIMLGNSSELDYKLKFAKKVLTEEVTEKEKGQIIVSTVGKCNFIPEVAKKSTTKKVASS